jgi:hypothetical protein
MEIRSFFSKFDVHAGATASAYIETQSSDRNSTKL